MMNYKLSNVITVTYEYKEETSVSPWQKSFLYIQDSTNQVTFQYIFIKIKIQAIPRILRNLSYTNGTSRFIYESDKRIYWLRRIQEIFIQCLIFYFFNLLLCFHHIFFNYNKIGFTKKRFLLRMKNGGWI